MFEKMILVYTFTALDCYSISVLAYLASISVVVTLPDLIIYQVVRFVSFRRPLDRRDLPEHNAGCWCRDDQYSLESDF